MSCSYLDLNTSHVKVQLSPLFSLIIVYTNLNTSHVKVQLTLIGNKVCKAIGFKYISC